MQTLIAASVTGLSVVVLSLSLPAPAFARTETCRHASQKEIAALFDRWNASLQTGDPDKVVANYATRSILLPTVSNQPRLTPETKRDYFVSFLKKKPVGKIDMNWIEIDCNTAIDAGLYTFTFGDGSTVHARYTFTYRWSGKRWLITSHHSSAMPEAQ
ncbi:SgcJ/EcaC family oxidoreductase [Paraburkholderia sp. J12]|uniref:SgcJ/EcaC family oxidoreductase n=1 Tax=Paraburkholderia sp. J12 TaxID=2805432 RepID=UPI002ABD2486|nr:SgcJ/EcaC family oxidoreductase [Paraburkholderia sp. J12]